MKAKVDMEDLKRDLNKMSKLASSLLVDQKALVLADSVDKEYDLAKYRKQALKNFLDECEDGDSKD